MNKVLEFIAQYQAKGTNRDAQPLIRDLNLDYLSALIIHSLMLLTSGRFIYDYNAMHFFGCHGGKSKIEGSGWRQQER